LDYKNWQLDFFIAVRKRDNYDYISNVPGGGQVNQSNTSGDAWQQMGIKAVRNCTLRD
jgi:hypothetical protein